MKVRTTVSSVLVALLVFVSLTGVAAAHGSGDAGASYHCSEGQSGGGNGVWVSSGGDFSPVNLFTVLGTSGDAAFYAQQKADDPQGSDTCDDGGGESTDYAEAHAGPVQACHTDNADDETDVRTDGGDACHPSQTE